MPLSASFSLLFDHLFLNELIKIIVEKIMESNGILSVLWITNFEKALLRLFKLISVEVKKILPFINPLWFCALAFFYSQYLVFPYYPIKSIRTAVYKQ